MSNALVSISNSIFELLQEAEVSPINLISEYWTPEKDGECRRLIFNGIFLDPADDSEDKAQTLQTVHFIEPTEGGLAHIVRNASTRLVKAFVEKPWLVPGESMFLITYIGKRKFRNGHLGDDWRIQQLKPKTKPNTDDNVEL